MRSKGIVRALKRVALGAAALLLLAVFWGGFVEPRLVDVERHDAVIPGLPASWEGRKVAFLSDLQLGMWGANVGTVRKIVDRVLDEKPAIVLLGGDLLYGAEHVDDQLDALVELLAPLPQAGIETFAVLGNHDLEQGAGRELTQTLERIGIVVLENEAVAVTAPNQPGEERLYVVGVGPAYGGNDDPEAAVSRVPEGAARVVFMHNPRSFAKLSAGTAPLAIAGHTHGGQVQAPFTDWSPMAVVLDVPLAGWSDDFGTGDNRLYVNRGIGFSMVPMRISCQPELTIFNLTRGLTE